MPRWGVDCSDPRSTYDSQGRHTGYSYPTCPDTGRCCVASAQRRAERDGRAVFGRAGKCGVCGAHFVYGTMFRHETGELVHMGHDCADKYSMMYDLSAHELEQGRHKAAHATAIARTANETARREFYDAHPGVEQALELGKENGTKAEQILADMARRFVQFRSLSDKQVTFALKLADEIRNPRPEIVERHCAAPVGKGVNFEGEIVSCKLTDGYTGGSSYKMTVKVTTEDGSTWLAYGTCPTSLTACLESTSHYGGGNASDLRGRRVSIKAALELPRDRRNGENHFVFMLRPSACFIDLYDHPRYQVPKCVIGEPCRIVCRKFDGLSGTWTPVICDGSCKNVEKARKPRDKKAQPVTSP